MSNAPYVKTPPISAILNRVGLFTRYAVLSWVAFYFAAATTIPYIFVPLLIIGFTSSLCGASVMLSVYEVELYSLPFLIAGVGFVVFILFTQILNITAGLLVVAGVILVERWFHLRNVDKTNETTGRK